MLVFLQVLLRQGNLGGEMEAKGQVVEINWSEDYKQDYYVVTVVSRFYLHRNEMQAMGTFHPGKDVHINFYPKIELTWSNMEEVEKEQRLKRELKKRLKRNPRMLRIGEEGGSTLL
jgi:hypothetical protein